MPTESARRYATIVQAPGGYPPRGAPPEPAPDPPNIVLHTVVLADDYEALEAERDELLREVAQLKERNAALRERIDHA